MFGKKKLRSIIFLLMFVCFYGCNVQSDVSSRMKLFDLNWKFNFGNDISASKVDYNDQNWRIIDLPHNWKKDNELERKLNNQPDSILWITGWYRKNFEIPKEWIDKSIQIDFEGICNQSEIFVNGKPIADSKKYKSSLHAVLNPYLNSRGKNVIAIRVAVPKQSYSSQQTETGIYKHVWLVIKEPAEFKD